MFVAPFQRSVCIFLLAGLLVLTAGQARAEMRFGFDLNEALSDATHIVKVQRNHEAPGKPYKVIEAWRGELEVGYEFDPGVLTLEVPGASMVLSKDLFPDEAGEIASGDCLILFLIDKTQVEDDPRLAKLEAGEARPLRWMPAGSRFVGLHEFGKAAVWLENGRAYLLAQTVNPGPLHLLTRYSATEFELYVKSHDLLRKKLDTAIKEGDIELLSDVCIQSSRHNYMPLWKRSLEAISALDPETYLVFAEFWNSIRSEGYHDGAGYNFSYRNKTILGILARSEEVYESGYFNSLLSRCVYRFNKRMKEYDPKHWTEKYESSSQKAYAEMCEVLRHVKRVRNGRLRDDLIELMDRLVDDPNMQQVPEVWREKHGDALKLIEAVMNAGAQAAN